MKILNTTTNKIETLIYAPTGCDCLPDLVADDPTITWSETEDGEPIRAASDDSIDFWLDWIDESKKADALQDALSEKIGKEEASELCIDACNGVEFNDVPRARIAALTVALAQA